MSPGPWLPGREGGKSRVGPGNFHRGGQREGGGHTQGSENPEVKLGCRVSQKAVYSFCLGGTSHTLAVSFLDTSCDWDLTTPYHTGRAIVARRNMEKVKTCLIVSPVGPQCLKWRQKVQAHDRA